MQPMLNKYAEAVEPEWVELAGDPPSFPRPSITAATLRGRKYERAAQEELLRRYGPEYIPEPWFRYGLEGRAKWCQMDGLLVDLKAGRLTIAEIKLQHTQKALAQMWNLYMPVLQKLLPGWDIATCEVVKWFDCAVQTAVPVVLKSEVHAARPGEFAVHIFNPKHRVKV